MAASTLKAGKSITASGNRTTQGYMPVAERTSIWQEGIKATPGEIRSWVAEDRRVRRRLGIGRNRKGVA